MADLSRMPTEFEHISLFMRAIAYQQFTYQSQLNFEGIARQELLFSRVPDNHFFQVRFKDACGISISDFLRLALCLLFRIRDSNSCAVTADWFSTVAATYPRQLVCRFLDTISVDINDLPVVLRESEGPTRRAQEYYEDSPFLFSPMIREGDIYWCTYPEVLQESLDHFVYDTLKRFDLCAFNDAFGKRFEGYVGSLIRSASLQYVEERELIRLLPDQSGCVDFLVAEGNANIFIDAKGVEMAQRGKIAHLREVIYGATKTSLVKAFKQGHEVCSRLPPLSNDHPTFIARPNNYLLAITYKELHIGNGVSLEAAVGADTLNRIRENYAQEHQIPLENIYFLTIEEFEGLIHLIKSGHIGLVEALERAKLTDANPQTRKFIFIMHLKEWMASLKLSPPLHETSMELLQDIETALGGRG